MEPTFRWIGLLSLVVLVSGCSVFRSAVPGRVPVHHVAAREGTLEAGASVVDLTPTEPVYLAGYGPVRVSRDVHDPITCRALALKRGSVELIIVAADFIGLQRGDLTEVREALTERGVDPRQVWIVCTHNHSGPDTLGLWAYPPIVSGQDADYMDRVRAGILTAVDDARAAYRPAELATTSFRVPPTGMMKNIRRPGLIDPEVPVLDVRERDGGATIATLIEFACHPEVLDRHTHSVTSDYPHPFREKLEATHGGVSLYVSGALGGLVAPDVVEGADLWAETERIGQALADGTLAALAKMAADEYDSAPTLAIWQTAVFVECTNFGYHLLRFTGLLDRKLYRGDFIETEVSLLEIGRSRWAGVPGEITPDLGLRIDRAISHPGPDGRAVGPCSVVGLVNDEVGYLLPSWDYALPLFSYERTLCPSRFAGDRVWRRLEDLGLLASEGRPRD